MAVASFIASTNRNRSPRMSADSSATFQPVYGNGREFCVLTSSQRLEQSFLVLALLVDHTNHRLGCCKSLSEQREHKVNARYSHITLRTSAVCRSSSCTAAIRPLTEACSSAVFCSRSLF